MEYKQPTNAEVLTALNGSIMKWRRVANGTMKDDGANNCPLCKLFLKASENHTCKGCPVNVDTKREGCLGSPYEVWDAAVHNEEEALNGMFSEYGLSLLAKSELYYLLHLRQKFFNK